MMQNPFGCSNLAIIDSQNMKGRLQNKKENGVYIRSHNVSNLFYGLVNK